MYLNMNLAKLPVARAKETKFMTDDHTLFQSQANKMCRDFLSLSILLNNNEIFVLLRDPLDF